MTADTESSTVCMFPLFHMAGWSMAMGAFQSRRPLHFVTHRRRPTTCWRTVERHRATAPLPHPRGLGAGARARPLRATTCRRSRDADTGTSATPPELVAAIRDAFPDTSPASSTDRPRPGRARARRSPTCCASPVRSGSPRPASRCASATPARSACTSDVPHGRLLRAARRDRRGAPGRLVPHRRPRRRSTTRATSRSSGRARDVLRTGGETVAPLEVEDALRDHPAIARGRRRRHPRRPSGARSCAPSWSRAPAAKASSTSTRCVRTASDRLARVQAAAPGRAGRRAPAHAGDRPDPAHADRRAHHQCLEVRARSGPAFRRAGDATLSDACVRLRVEIHRRDNSGTTAVGHELTRGDNARTSDLPDSSLWPAPWLRSAVGLGPPVSASAANDPGSNQFSNFKKIKEPRPCKNDPGRHRHRHQDRPIAPLTGPASAQRLLPADHRRRRRRASTRPTRAGARQAQDHAVEGRRQGDTAQQRLRRPAARRAGQGLRDPRRRRGRRRQRAVPEPEGHPGRGLAARPGRCTASTPTSSGCQNANAADIQHELHDRATPT